MMRLKDFTIRDLVEELTSRGVDLSQYNKLFSHEMRDSLPKLYWLIASINFGNKDENVKWMDFFYSSCPGGLADAIEERL